MRDTCVPSASYAIPLHRLPIDNADVAAMTAAVVNGLLTGDGVSNQRLAALAEQTLGCARAFPAPSGTHALELMMRALPLAPGDEVILPSFTFVSAANAVILAGGRPVLADIDAQTLNLDPSDAAARVTARTRAVLTGHYAGIAAGLDALIDLASRAGIALVEDAAHALGGRWRGRPLGTVGRAAAFSFHGTKNLVAGEGGMMVTVDPELAARAEIIREKGTDRSRFVRGDVDRYSWQTVGSSYLLSDLLAALVASQWQRLDRITADRRGRFEFYQTAFAPLAASGDLSLPVVPVDCEPAYHIYFVRFATAAARDAAMAFVRARGIEASSHFVPLHLSPYAKRWLGGRAGDCPVTENAADRLLRLPLYPALAADDQRRVVDAVFAFFAGLLIAQHKLNDGITSDGALYFAHLRSAVFDHDLDIAAELDALHQPPRPHHVVPIGPAIAWAPAYLAVAAADWLAGAAGGATDTGVARGLGPPYVEAIMLSSFGVMAAGLVMLHLRLRREFDPAIALIASVLTVAATMLAWYVVFEPSMTHAVSFGVVAIALVLTERWTIDAAPTRRQSLALGAWFSLVLVVRPEDAVFAVFPLSALLFAPACRALAAGERLRVAGAMLAGAAPLILLQVAAAAWLLSVNRFTLAGGDEGYLNFLNSRWSDVLFSSRHGLLTWTPFVWVALLGTIAYTRRRPLWAIPALIAFAALVWTNGSAHDWAGGWAFGGRRFTSVLAAFAPGVGLAVLAAYRRPLLVIAPAAAAIVGWNALLMTQYQRGLLPRDETVRFDTLVRQQAELVTRAPFFYPFAFPANVWFAWREGLPIDRYDLLGSEPLRAEMYLPLNDWGERFLLDGWQNGAGDEYGSRHYLVAPSGTILVPLDVPGDQAFAIDLEARADGEPRGAETRLDLSVNGRSFGDLRLEIGAAKPSRRAFVAPAGAKIWRRGYNRVTITRPTDAAPATRFLVYALRVGAAAGGRVP